jgi:hypothetical protein
MVKYSFWLFCILFFCLPFLGMAQFELSGGLELGMPEVVTSNNNFITPGQISSGLRAGVTYRPEEVEFFPSLQLSYGNVRLPLQEHGNNVAALNFRYLNLMVNEHYALQVAGGQFLICGGIGLSYLGSNGVAPSGVQTIQTTIDSTANISKVFPAMNIGAEYHIGETEDRPLYFAVGVNVQYTMLFRNSNTYCVTVAEPGNKFYSYKSNLSGSLLSPVFYVAVHYKLRKTKTGMYL